MITLKALPLTLILNAGLYAAPVLSPPVSPCLSAAGASGSSTDTVLPFSVWSAQGFACEAQDKIFSNFSAGAIPATTTLRIEDQQVGAVDVHTVSLNGSFLADFTISYDIAVDHSLAPADVIVRVSGDLSNPSVLGNPANVKSVFLEDGSLVGVTMCVPDNPGPPILTDATALHVEDAYTANGGAAVNIANSFEQAAPEPVTWISIAGGLALIGLGRRRRKA